jgi:hypothetical protein
MILSLNERRSAAYHTLKASAPAQTGAVRAKNQKLDRNCSPTRPTTHLGRLNPVGMTRNDCRAAHADHSKTN